MLSRSESGNINGGCKTIAICRRSDRSRYSRTSTPSIATRPFRWEASGTLFEIGFGIENLKNPAGSHSRPGDEPPALGDLIDRRVELGEVGDENDQLPDRQGARHHRPRPD